jgi:hypothetical protein
MISAKASVVSWLGLGRALVWWLPAFLAAVSSRFPALALSSRTISIALAGQEPLRRRNGHASGSEDG